MRRLFFASIILTSIILCGCTSENIKEYSKTIYAMDTVMNLKISSTNGENILKKADTEVMRIENLLDRGNKNSEIYKINSEKSCVISNETADLIKTSLSISEETNGAFDITTAPITDLWGFYDSDFHLPSNEDIKSTLKSVGYEQVQLNGTRLSIPNNACIDLGGIGKGYTSDRIVKILKQNGVNSAIISLGGNVYAIGKKINGELWTVGVANPSDPTQHIGKLKVSDSAVVTSGGYQRCFEQDGVIYHHIINPDTGYSAQSGLASVTIISESGTRADGLSTSLFVMGLDKSIELWRKSLDFDAIFITDDGTIFVTEGISGNFECAEKYEVIEK